MKKRNMRKIQCLLIAGLQILMLTSCGALQNEGSHDDLYWQYDQSQNAFSQYNGVELSVLPGHGDNNQETASAEDETPFEKPSEEETPLYAQLFEFADGGCGLLAEYDNQRNRELPMEIQEAEYPRIAPGGLTKFMTAYLILKYGNPEDTITYQISYETGLENAKKAGFSEGDVLTVEQMLYAMFVASGNDAANALAIYLKGSIEDFTALMNEEAARLGAKNTQFVNPTGLDAEGQYTTLFDMYLIVSSALSYDYMMDFIQVSAVNGTYLAADGTEISYQWVNPNEFVNMQFQAEGAVTLAGQSSLTSGSGYCGMYYYMSPDNTLYLGIAMKVNGYENFYGDMKQMIENQL